MSATTITSVEIFRAGDYGAKGVYTPDDLASMAADYSPDTHDAPVTVDHKQEGPAFGWVRNLRALKGRLFADFHNVPAEFATAIREGAFNKRSSEIYRSMPATGRPYLKAVTMLGAAAPAVKGMDPIKFAENAGEFATFDAEPMVVATFGDMPKPPDGASFGVLVKQVSTGDMGDHWHNAYVDAEGNGYTGPPQYGDGGHQHVVSAGVVQAAGDPPHVHSMQFQTFSDSDNGVKTMPEPKAPDAPQGRADDPEFKKFAEEFAEREKAMAARVAAAEAKAARIEAERFAEREAARFEAAFAEALAAGKATPAEKDALAFAFSHLPHDESEGVAKFGESKLSPRAAFLAAFAARPVVIGFGDAMPGATAKAAASPDGNVASFDDRVHAEACRLAKEKGVSPDSAEFSDLVVAAIANLAK